MTFTASNGTPPYTFSLSPQLPSSSGFKIGTSSNNGTFSATNPVAGTYSNFYVTVTDNTGATANTSNYTLIVNPAATLTASPLPNASVSTVYSQTISVTSGGTGPFTLALASGSTLPPGLSLGSQTLLPTTFISSGLSSPYAMAFDTAGNLYVCNKDSNTVSRFSSTGTLVKANFASGLSVPEGLAFDAAGNLYVSNNSLNTVSKFDSSGTLVNASFATGLTTPRGLAFDGSGILYVANYIATNSTVSKVTPAGGAAATFATGLNYAEGLKFDTAGNLYVSGNDIVAMVTSTGTVSTFSTGETGSHDLARDPAGNFYVSDNVTTIYKVPPSGGADQPSSPAGLLTQMA